jgi:hypothetical protein
VLADLDSDGRTDIVTGEMTAGGWSFPSPVAEANEAEDRSAATT